MSTRRFAILAVIVAGLLIGALFINVTLRDRSSLQSARDSLAEARAFLDANPAYRHLSVEVSDTEGGALCFSGSLPTISDEIALTKDAEARFGDRGFQIIAIIFYDEANPSSTRPSP